MGLKQYRRVRAPFRRVRPPQAVYARWVTAEQVEPRVLLAADPGAKDDHPLHKLEGALANLHAEFTAFTKATPGRGVEFRPANSLLRARGGLVAIDAIAAGDPNALLAELQALGLRHGAAVGSVVGGLLPIGALDELAAHPAVDFARHGWAVTQAQLDAVANADGDGGAVAQKGSTTSQADVAMRSDVARSQYGVKGAGSIVGVLSDSFNTSGDGSYATDQNTGDLPAGVNVLEELAGGTDEGRAMLQLVHDVAPGAGLAFHTAFVSEAGFAQGITDLRNAGADVIVDDVIWLSEPMFQDGIIAQSVDAAVAAGVPYFSSAGNQGRRAYESAFRAGPFLGGSTIPVDPNSTQAPSTFYGGTTHDFDPGTGVDYLQKFTLGANQYIQLSLQWDSPYRSAGPIGSNNDLDVYVLNADGTKVVGGSASDNKGADPTEVFSFRNTTGATATFNLMMTKWGNDPAPGFVKYVNFGTHNFSEFATPRGTLFGHANAAGASAVAAAFYGNTPAFGVSPPILESFSTRGRTPIFFDGGGNRLSAAVYRAKPNITAPDGTNTTFFGSDISYDSDTFPNFYGTSAAAPHAAAVAALMQDAAGFISPAAIYRALESTALDMDDPDLANFQSGRDDASGFGLIRADLAVGAVVPGASATATPGAPDLLTGFDLGTSNFDNLTNLDNGGPGRGLQFSVPDTVAGATVTVYAGGIAIGSAVAGGTTTTVSTNESFDLVDGAHSITARQAEPGKSASAASAALTVTIDTVAPTVDIIDVSPDPRATAVDLIDIVFSEAVSSIYFDTLTLTRDGVEINLQDGVVAITRPSNRAFQLGSLLSKTGAVGEYVLTFDPAATPPGTVSARDRAGNLPVVGASETWRVSDTAPVALRAAADAYVRDGTHAATNFGGTASLISKRSNTAGNTRQSYLRFDLSGVASVATAKLRLFGALSNTVNSSVTTTVYSSSNTSWPELTTNWNNRPAVGTTARGAVTVSGTTGRWYELDLTSFLKAEKAAGRNLVTLALMNNTSSDAQTVFNSDEAAANRPELVVTPDGPAQQEVLVSPASLTVPEGGSASFQVKLAMAPTENVNVVVWIPPGSDEDITQSTYELTFTPSNWNVAQTATINAAEDDDTANGTVSIGVGAGPDVINKTVTVTEADNDAPAGPVAIRAAADAYVRNGTYASTNYGGTSSLIVKRSNTAGNTRQSYLRFDLSGVPSVAAAKLRLFGALSNTVNASVATTVYNSSNTSWPELTTNWNNRPAVGTTARGTVTVSGTAAKWYELDLTSFLKAEKAAGRNLVTLALVNNSTSDAQTTFHSDEGANPPQLLVT